MTLILGKKLTELTARVAPASTDLLYIYNSTTGQSNKVTLDALGIYFGLQPSGGGVTDNIYTADDALTSERTIDGNEENLHFVNLNEFNIGSVSTLTDDAITFIHQNDVNYTTTFGEFTDTTDSGDGFYVKGFQHRDFNNEIDYLFAAIPDDEGILIKTSAYTNAKEARITISSTYLEILVEGNYSTSIGLDEDGKVFLNGRTVRLPNDPDPDTNVLTPLNGMLSYDTTDHEFRAYVNGAWTGLGGEALDATLLIGNTTNGTDIVISEGDNLVLFNNISGSSVGSKVLWDTNIWITYDDIDKGFEMKTGGIWLWTDNNRQFYIQGNSISQEVNINGFSATLGFGDYTAPRNWDLPDKSGTIALTLDTLYGGDGTLISNRTVTGNTFDLNFTNVGVFGVTSNASIAMTCDSNMVLTSISGSINAIADKVISLISNTDDITVTSTTGRINLNGRIDLNNTTVTNLTLPTYQLDFQNTNIIEFTADGNVVLSFINIPTKGTVVINIDTNGFVVSLATASGWFSNDGVVPTITGKTIITAISDGTNLYISEISDLIEL